MNGQRSRIARKAIAVAIGVSGMIVGVGLPDALAVTQGVDGQAGAVTVYKAQGNFGDIITIPSWYAWRSPGTTGAQTVYVQYAVGRPVVGGSWTTGWVARTIPAGAQGVWLPAQAFDVTSLKGTAPYSATLFKVGMEIHWHVATTGAFLGVRGVMYDQGADYQCPQSLQSLCIVSSNGVIFMT